MPRYNVQHPVTKEWRCFSSIVDDWITDWMDEDRYQKWREYEYGRQAGALCEANQLSLESVERIIKEKEQWGEQEDSYETGTT